MTAQIRKVAAGLVVLFVALIINLNYLAVVEGEELRTDERNARGLIEEYEIARGAIIAGQGADSRAVAASEETDGRLRYRREYPEGPRYAHVSGYHSFIYGRSELEASFNDFLTGSAPEAFARNVADLLTGRRRDGDTVQLTLDPATQQAAVSALGGATGAAVALDPATGEVLALTSSPSYDPNRLASHDGEVVRQAWSELSEAEPDPRLNRAVRETYPPGSTFKLVTAAAALESGLSPDTAFADPRELELPLTSATIGNFDGGTCNGGDPITLGEALVVSCNTTFGQIGLDLGADRLVRQAERFGLNRELEFQLPDPAESVIPSGLDEPSTAQSAIGQRDVRVTPLAMTLITAAIANDGQAMTPRVVRHVEDVSGRVLRGFEAEPLAFGGEGRAVSRTTAGALRDMMEEAVASGTGTAARIDGVAVAGKTGTAQRGEDEPPTVWFTGFASAEDPQVAVTVVVTDPGMDGTGGAVAAPLAREIMRAALDDSG